MIAGTPVSFSVAFTLVLAWAVSGPIFGFSDTWQLVINTGTTIITFLMVFLIQNAQNRDAVAVQLKLDELIRVVKGARMGMINLDQLSDTELMRLRQQFQELGNENGACDELEAGINTEERVDVNVRTTFDDDGHLESQEVNRARTTQRTTTLKTEESDDGDEEHRTASDDKRSPHRNPH